MSLTLCLTTISPHDLREYENEADNDEENVSQKMPAPLSPLHSQNVLGDLRAYLYQYVLGPISTYLSPNVPETLTKLAEEQVCYDNEDLPQNVLEPNASKPLDEPEPLIVSSCAFMPMYELDPLKKLA